MVEEIFTNYEVMYDEKYSHIVMNIQKYID